MKLTPEEQAEKDKEAVQKMIGAKSAMEAALREIERLKGIIWSIDSVHQDIMKATNTDAFVRAYRKDDGLPFSEPRIVSVKALHEVLTQWAKSA